MKGISAKNGCWYAPKNLLPNVRCRTNSVLFKQEIMEAGLAVGFTNAMISDQLHKIGKYRVTVHSPDVMPVKTCLTRACLKNGRHLYRCPEM